MDKTSVSIDEMLPHVGEMGPFQIMQETFLCLMLMVHYFTFYISYFAALDSPWECVSNSTICILNGTISAGDSHYKDRCTMPRGDWQFTQADEFSLVTHFELYCDSKWMSQMTTSITHLGWFFGGLMMGSFADRFGRRRVLFVCISCQIFGNFLCAFSSNIWFLICIRFFLGLSIPGSGLQGFILITEMTGSRYRTIASSIYWQFIFVSNSVLALTASYVREWKLLFIICSAPYIFVLGFFPFLTESMRWLQMNGKRDRAMEVLRRAAKFNGRKIPEGLELKNIDQSVKNKSPSITTLFKSRKSTAQILTLCFAWVSVNMLCYGLSLSSGNFGGNVYLNFFLVSSMELPGAIIYGFAANMLGRKKTVINSCFLASLACFSMILITSNSSWIIARIAVGMFGKLCTSIFYNSIYQWGAELYPTTIRATATSFMQAASPLGGSTAPWIINYLKDVHDSAPYATMGGIALLSAISMLRLPETKGKSIDESGEDEQRAVCMANNTDSTTTDKESSSLIQF